MKYGDRKRINKNGYIVVEFPEHQKAFDTGTGLVGVYEHVLVAENYVIDRQLREGEVVHHLDSNRSNNSPDNLLVMHNSMHSKLHQWMNKHEIMPSNLQTERNNLGCIRCIVCDIPIQHGMKYCCDEHAKLDHRKFQHPTKEQLTVLLWNKPTTQVAEELGVSDIAVAKLAKKLGVDKPPRGFWRQVETGNICPLPIK